MIIKYLATSKMPRLFAKTLVSQKLPGEQLKSRIQTVLPGHKPLFPSESVFYPALEDELLRVKQTFVIDYVYNVLVEVGTRMSIGDVAAWILVDVLVACHVRFIRTVLAESNLNLATATPDLALSIFKEIFLKVLGSKKPEKGALLFSPTEIESIIKTFFIQSVKTYFIPFSPFIHIYIDMDSRRDLLRLYFAPPRIPT